MIDPAIISAAASVVSAIAASVAAGGIWHGIRAMVRANKDRAGILDQQREADERRHTEAMRRHAEAMQAGDQRHAEAMRRHTEAMRRHDEAMQAGDQRHAEAMQADERRHDEAMRALETLIARTAPAPTIRRNRPLLR